MSHTLIVEIDQTQVESLVTDGYTLCIAKAKPKVTATRALSDAAIPNVIWAGTGILNSNTFEWTNNYKVFGARFFTAGAIVEQQTAAESIEFGQTCTIDAAGVIGPATGVVDRSGEFTLANNHTPLSSGVTCSLTLPGGTPGEDLPIYVSKTHVLKGGMDLLTPVDRVTVWFQQGVQTSQMIERLAGPAHVIDFTGGNSKQQTVSFTKDGDWTAGPLPPSGPPKGDAKGSACH